MVSVVTASFESLHLVQLHNWFVAEWKDVDPFKDSRNGHTIPPPLIAVEDEALLGGLAFTRYKIPDVTRVGLWVCALYVDVAHRNKGIGSRLIREAEKSALSINENELFALTNIPAFYENFGWEVVCKDDKGTVVKRDVQD